MTELEKQIMEALKPIFAQYPEVNRSSRRKNVIVREVAIKINDSNSSN